MTPNVKSRRRQRGAALLLMMLVVIIGVASILVTKLNRNAGQALQSAATQRALAEAKDALLAYAMSYPDTHPGSAVQLPCPDLDFSGGTLDGESHTLNCGAAGVTMLGRLPWKTLGIAPPQDGGAECIWYVVSGEHKSADTSTSPMINPDSNGQLELYQKETGFQIAGQTPDSRPVAMIVAAGPATGNQIRQAPSLPGQQCSDDFTVASFLEADAGTGFSNAVTLGAVGIDQFVRAAGVERPRKAQSIVGECQPRFLPATRQAVASAKGRRQRRYGATWTFLWSDQLVTAENESTVTARRFCA